MRTDLPLYVANLDENSDMGITAISLVEEPAVERSFQMYSKQPQYFAIQEEEHILTGVIMIPDFPIYRRDAERGEFYQIFKADTIKVMAEKMLKDNTFNTINFSHNHNLTTDDVQLVEVFIKNNHKGINPKGFEDLADGSLFVSYKVKNKEIWDDIKKGKFTGFSLEGVFQVLKVVNKPIDKTEMELEILKQMVRGKLLKQ